MDVRTLVLKMCAVFLAVGLACPCLTPRPARAAVMLALDMPQLVEAADHIVLATALDRHSRWDIRGKIVTDVRLRVDEPIKGDYEAGDELLVTRLGGRIGDLGMRVEGAARFELGKRAVVFVREVPALGELRVVGMSQGVLRLEQEGETEVVACDSDGALLLDRARDGALTKAAPLLPKRRPVPEVLSQIRRLVSRAQVDEARADD